MLELKQGELVFTFPEIHPDAKLTVSLHRTLRIPDDGQTYPLPPSFGTFPLKHVDDYSATIPERWKQHGGLMFPMYQSEALWIQFSSKYLSDHNSKYPFAVKIATGKINAITGTAWNTDLSNRPQDYLVAPEQPWLDGYCVKKGLVRQFVAMPLGSGYSAEEQLTGKSEIGGLQIIVYPMKNSAFLKRFPERRPFGTDMGDMLFQSAPSTCESKPDMGIAPGGRMKQEIYEDPYDFDDWDLNVSNRCFIHSTNSLVWRGITGEEPPTVPPTSKEYQLQGLPWFDYYGEQALPVKGSGILNSMKSIFTLGGKKGGNPLPENESVKVDSVVKISKDQIREGDF